MYGIAWCVRAAVQRGQDDEPTDGLAWDDGQWYRVQSGRPESVGDVEEECEGCHRPDAEYEAACGGGVTRWCRQCAEIAKGLPENAGVEFHERDGGRLMACGECGCTDIEYEAWVHANTDLVVGEGGSDAYWCPQCEDHGKRARLVRVEKPFRV